MQKWSQSDNIYCFYRTRLGESQNGNIRGNVIFTPCVLYHLNHEQFENESRYFNLIFLSKNFTNYILFGTFVIWFGKILYQESEEQKWYLFTKCAEMYAEVAFGMLCVHFCTFCKIYPFLFSPSWRNDLSQSNEKGT